MKKNLKFASLFLSVVTAMSSVVNSGMASVFAETNTDTSKVLLGDANADGSVNVRDCAFIAGQLAQGKASALQAAADYNKDGKKDVRDAAALAKDIAAGAVSNDPAVSDELPEYENHTVSKKAVKVYDADDEKAKKYTSCDMYFIDGINDIPYIDAEGIVNMLNYAIRKDDPHTKYTAEYIEGRPAARINKNVDGEVRTDMQIDFENGTLTFTDLNLFILKSDAVSILDITCLESTAEDGSKRYFDTSGNNQRSGEVYTVSLADYGIRAVYKNGKGYIPLQTASDMFLTQKGSLIMYNGKIGVIRSSVLSDKVKELYYSVGPKERSKELAEFTFAELCLAFDNNYGLKKEHNISNFKSLIMQSGLYDDMISTDPVKADTALCGLLYQQLDDIHSYCANLSPYSGMEADVKVISGTSYSKYFKQQYNKYHETRAAYYPDGVPEYEKIGNTAYITFDSFIAYEDIDYYSKETPVNLDDTLELISYANQQIKNDPEIENVVLDLSCNGGGVVDAGIFTAAWLLGDADLALQDPLTGAQAVTEYKADINFDLKYDENDTVKDKNIFCITSPLSFSCGNLVSSILKSSDNVTIIGRPTGGGACSVYTMSTADGAVCSMSSRLRISTVENGSYYNIDRGVQPDHVLSTPEQFYDREALTKYINATVLNKSETD